MRSMLFALTALVVGASAMPGTAQTVTPRTAEAVRGQTLVSANCSSCHAIGARGASPSPAAPAFRTLAQNDPVAHLEEALAEGISVEGHTEAQEYAFAPDEVNAIVAYLETIQTSRRTRTAPAAVGR